MSEKTNQQIFFRSSKNSNNDEDTWRTSNQYAFHEPPSQKLTINGRRRDWVRKIVTERVLERIASDMRPQKVTNDGDNPSEYIDNFCDPEFTPFMDQLHGDVNMLLKYPLYACNNQTLYKEYIEKSGLKSRSDISNWNEPFRKNCAFTTSPDQAFREPFGGY